MQFFIPSGRPSSYSTPSHCLRTCFPSWLLIQSHTHTHAHTHTHICACPLVYIFRSLFFSCFMVCTPQHVTLSGKYQRDRGGGNTRELFQGPQPTCKQMLPREHHLPGHFHPPAYAHTSLLIRIPTLQLTPLGSSQQKATALPVDQVKWQPNQPQLLQIQFLGKRDQPYQITDGTTRFGPLGSILEPISSDRELQEQAQRIPVGSSDKPINLSTL